jgi:F-type H+-transporting ATPase subunit b
MSLFVPLFLAPVWPASSAVVETHGASASQLIFPFINFLIFLYLIKRFLLPYAKDYLRSRHEEIVRSLKEADEGKRRAEAMVQDYRGRLRRLDEESKKIREELRADGGREKAKLLSEAEELATKISADADFLAEQEFKLARQRLREEIARRAETVAAQLVRRHLTADDQKRFVEEFLGGIGKVL